MLTCPFLVSITLLLVLLTQIQADAGGNAALLEHDAAIAGNPLLPGKGICDPQVRVYGDRAYLYATHDASPIAANYHMENWWVWASDDLVHWRQVSTLKPTETYFGRPSGDCWATDAISRNGKYYFYFSMGPRNIGVVMGDSPEGPWHDPLGKPLIPEGLSPTEARDPGIFQAADGTGYIVFGTWDYFLANLNDDMISLAETPRRLIVTSPAGPYGPGKLDDKPFLHEYQGKYYLSWGCYYAMSDTLYGPYHYKGSVIVPERTAPEFQRGLTMDRHGSFFELHHQWYFICNDQSFPGSSAHFRNSVISYVHYRDNGEIEPVYLNRLGVGQYDASAPRIEAENYFRLIHGVKKECPAGGFEVRGLGAQSSLVFPNVRNLPANSLISLHLSCAHPRGGTVEIRRGSPNGELLGKCKVPETGGWASYRTVSTQLKNSAGTHDLCLVFHGGPGELFHLDWFRFQPAVKSESSPD